MITPQNRKTISKFITSDSLQTLAPAPSTEQSMPFWTFISITPSYNITGSNNHNLIWLNVFITNINTQIIIKPYMLTIYLF